MRVAIPQAEQPGLARLLASGAAQWSGKKLLLQPAVRLTGEGKSVSALIVEDRA